MNKIDCPALYIKLIDSETRKDGVMYQTLVKSCTRNIVIIEYNMSESLSG